RADPSPAPDWTTTPCPACTSSRTPPGVAATRYSLSFTSVGIPTIMRMPSRRLAPSEAYSASDALDGIQLPRLWNALEGVLATIREHDPRAGDQVLHGS